MIPPKRKRPIKTSKAPAIAVAIATEYDDDKRPGRSADLYRTSSQCRYDESADDSSDKTFFGSNARSDTECDGKRERNDSYNDSGHKVGDEFFARIVAQAFEQFRLKINLHDYLKIFEAANVTLFLTKCAICVKFCGKDCHEKKILTGDVSCCQRIFRFPVMVGWLEYIGPCSSSGISSLFVSFGLFFMIS